MSISNIDSIISVEWLHQNLNAKNLVVLNATIPKVVGNTSELSKVQIPDTQFFDIKKVFSNLEGLFPNTIPDENQFREAAQNLGINEDSIIVVYDDLGIYSSPRAWWLFKVFGCNNVAVLDGGLPNWIAKGFPVETKQANTKPKGNFKSHYDANHLVVFNDLAAMTKSNTFKIIDARSNGRFNSSVPEPRKGLRSGTIPSSVNLPYKTVLENICLKPTMELEAIFEKLVTKEQHLVFSCGTGITACILALVASKLGYSNSVYDGSWTEYGTLIPN